MSTAVADAPEQEQLTAKDFKTSNDVRWCPGCGDYAILNAIQRTFPELGVPRENFVVVSGIGCSSRFPYYMNTYGFHTIHGRAPTVATGVKAANPDLSVWMVTGDGDGLSIGGNHLMHMLRRNVDVKVLLFNNQIYGLTKGQYSPTSKLGTKTKTTPYGSLDTPLNPIAFALQAEASFVARTADTNVKHMVDTFKQAYEHKGSAFIEIMQNCVIFNDKVWEPVYGRKVRDDTMIQLEEGKPLVWGGEQRKGIRLNGLVPEVFEIGEGKGSEDDALVHDSMHKSQLYPDLLAGLTHPDFPVPIGVFRRKERAIYTQQLINQIDAARGIKGEGDLGKLLRGANSWEVK